MNDAPERDQLHRRKIISLDRLNVCYLTSTLSGSRIISTPIVLEIYCLKANIVNIAFFYRTAGLNKRGK